jgi:hypothetical protein
VTSLVPGTVTINAEKTEFIFSATSEQVSRSLASICSACTSLDGQTTIKPAFTITFQADAPLPVDVDSVTLTRGTLDVRFTNGLSFDPIRPSAAEGAPRGSIVVTIRSGSTVLGTHTIDGANRALAPGAVVTETVSLNAAVMPKTIGQPIVIQTTLTSPEGDPVVINTAEALTVEAAEGSFAMSTAYVHVVDRLVSSAPVALDLDGLDSELTDRVQSGAVLVDLNNAFAVAGPLTVTISAPGITYNRPLTIAPGLTHSILSFTREELQSLIGATSVSLVVSGQVNATPEGSVMVTPAQQISIESRLELYLSSEGEGATQ